MAECEACNSEMLDPSVETCGARNVRIRGKTYRRNQTYFDQNYRCHDCNIVNHKGNVHHAGCDMERCPRCKGQIISCGCDLE